MKFFNKNKNDYNSDGNENIVGKIQSWFQFAENAREKYDQRWYVYDQFKRGNHYVYFNRTTNSLVDVASQASAGNRVRLAVNKTHAIIRHIKNTVLRYKPKWDIIPRKGNDESYEAARIGGKLLDNLWLKANKDGKNMNLLVKEVVDFGLTFGQGYLQVYWDSDKDDVAIEFLDTFDVYKDPRASSIESSGFIFKTPRVSVSKLKKSDTYANTDDIQGDNQLAASQRKGQILRYQMQTEEAPDPELATTILKECWYKNGTESSSDGEKIKVAAVTSDKLVRGPEETEMENYPIIEFRPEICPSQTYGESWIRDLMPLNKVGDRLESSIVEYNNAMLKGKYVTDKGAGVRSVNTQHGEIIEKNRGYELAQLNLKPLPASINVQIQNIWHYMEEIGGRNDASMGSVPSGVRSGKGIEALQSADFGNISDIADNLNIFLRELGKRVLNLYAENLTMPKEMALLGEKGTEFVEIAGKNYKGNKKGVIKMETVDDVKVDISSWLGVTKEAKQQKLTMWRQMGVIDNRTFLEAIEYGDTEKILDRLKEEAKMVQSGELFPPGRAKTPSAQPGQQAGGRPEGQNTSVPSGT